LPPVAVYGGGGGGDGGGVGWGGGGGRGGSGRRIPVGCFARGGDGMAMHNYRSPREKDARISPCTLRHQAFALPPPP
jgi:hypothetical protein